MKKTLLLLALTAASACTIPAAGRPAKGHPCTADGPKLNAIATVVPVDPEAARERRKELKVEYAKMIAAGDSMGYNLTGQLYEQEQDLITAKEWYEKGAAAGNGESYGLIGRLYLTCGQGIPTDFAKAKEWYERGIAAGYLNGYFDIARLYEMGGPGIKKDFLKAKEWYERDIKAKEAKEVSHGKYIGYHGIIGLYRVGGPGLPRDLAKAQEWSDRLDQLKSGGPGPSRPTPTPLH